jgi:outer membrane protein OmpA-like peptidoglycan-associated protein
MTTKSGTKIGLSVLVLGSTLGVLSAQAQSAQTPSATSQPTQAAPAPNGSMNPSDSGSYATGQPLQPQSREGFWGRVNPMARKKWVNRQVDPIKDRTNELDQLQAKNANDIKDVDSRAQAGIKNAMLAANTADQHAQDAANRANAANSLAGNASDRTTSLNGTVQNLDQYSAIGATEVPFASGRTTLGPQGKASLDDIAAKLEGQKGYVVEVQGFSRAGVPASQAMADAVVRYLVTEHQVPIFRIYRSGLGRNTETASADGEKVLVNGVRVTLLHNSLATMSSNSATSAAHGPTTSSATTGVSAPPADR